MFASLQENALLLLNKQFHDLADRSFVKSLKSDRLALDQFSRCALIEVLIQPKRLINHSRSGGCDFILVVNTHASPTDGGILYGNRKSTSLDAVSEVAISLHSSFDYPQIVDHLLGDLGNPSTMSSRFGRSVLIVLCCGGFVQHSLAEMRAIR